MAHIYLDELQLLAAAGLAAAGANAAMADSTARALVSAESQGLGSHGLSRVAFYAGHLRAGRAIGSAVPKLVHERGGAALIDAGSGLAYPACAMAVEQAAARAREHGVSFVGVTNSHHFGAAAYHLEALADAGLVALALSNSPAAMPAWGGKRPLFGTNPVAAVFPRRGGARLLIDLSLSQVARGKLMIAARDNQPIPLGWALDAEGQPTTDPKAGLAGSMLPAGGVKGAMLALIVELLVCALTGAHFGFETESFFVDEGGPARLGQAFLAIDPGALAGSNTYLDRVETLVDAMLEDEGVRLPGDRRRKLRDEALKHGIDIPDALMAQLRALSGTA
ncbi:(2R)-3-sulfolactate dehydrogenase (NADP(+)) [Achromobacter anxifer]|jgi:(2R)-3-sulfolactate dehydrogenase (NADP+)|uniref:(2R)-3-sulfolactate dehydrogenase (NADP(+)) n=1 Tax=Achromobacter anxifer TaxID=1287737 RepID=A0A6S7CQ81_9BURK|nr:Ldh family oxidoreductase [Achromobacter anxifer]CAB3857670.1 (2R)-3-sulfolactate dehydrogenase (NADP(+)) [Achromobacter anxifer]